MVIQKMEATRVAVEAAHWQHLEAYDSWRRTGPLPLSTALNHYLHPENGVWRTF